MINYQGDGDSGLRGTARTALTKSAAMLTGLTLALALGGCAVADSLSSKPKDDSGEDVAPVSQRVQILQLDERLQADPRIAEMPVTLPQAVVNTSWAQPGGSPSNGFPHLQLGDGSAAPTTPMKKLWDVQAGAGSSKDAPLTAPPLVANERIFVLDSRATVRAFDRKTGDRIWRLDLAPEGEKVRSGFGGGIALGEGVLVAVTGFGQVIGINPESGEEVWARRISVPIRSGPTATDGRVYVTATDNQLHAYDLATGTSLWSHRAMTETAGILSAVSPAVSSGVVVAPFSSGELVAFRIQNGREIWSDSLVRNNRSTAMAGINDIAARPVIDDGRVYAISHSGRMVSIDMRTGERVWAQNYAGIRTPWVSGEFVFVVTSQAELLCVSKRDGRIRWLTRLKRYENVEKRKGELAWMGPLLISGRLLMANSIGEMAFFDPATGNVLVAFAGPGELYIPPVVSNGVVYVLTDDGRLSALQ